MILRALDALKQSLLLILLTAAFPPQAIFAQYYYEYPQPGQYYDGYGNYYPRQREDDGRRGGNSEQPTERPRKQRSRPKPSGPAPVDPKAQKSLELYRAKSTSGSTEISQSKDMPHYAVNLDPDADHYVIVYQDSETLAELGTMTGSTQKQILELNDLKMSELREGQALVLPRKAEAGDKLKKLVDPSNQGMREVWRGIRGKKRVALTFDAGGEVTGASELLANLKESKAAASFFITGHFAKVHEKLTKQMADAGYPIYNHSWTHPEFTSVSDNQMKEELERTDAVVAEVTGKSTLPYWRPPFGDRDQRVLRVTAAVGYQSIYWTIDTLDSVGDKKDAQFVIDRVLNFPKAGDDPDRFLDGAIILMHVGEPQTAAAIPELVTALRQRGFSLVTVDEIMKP